MFHTLSDLWHHEQTRCKQKKILHVLYWVKTILLLISMHWHCKPKAKPRLITGTFVVRIWWTAHDLGVRQIYRAFRYSSFRLYRHDCHPRQRNCLNGLDPKVCMSVEVYVCLYMSVNIYVCLCMSVNMHACQCMSLKLHVCPCMAFSVHGLFH